VVVTVRKLKSVEKIITDLNTLARIVDGLKSEGKTIVLTNGCFDLLHVGHVRALEDARSRGDYLIVAVNGDKTVERLKGKGHPINISEERMEVLAALASVDYVTRFEEATADELLRKIKPTLHAKGHDYTEKTVPERETAKEIGARIVIVGDKKNHSTTQILQKIKKKKL
jgi:rfaE bifunctional protein nucleotidyltransferase chain/domain